MFDKLSSQSFSLNISIFCLFCINSVLLSGEMEILSGLSVMSITLNIHTCLVFLTTFRVRQQYIQQLFAFRCQDD